MGSLLGALGQILMQRRNQGIRTPPFVGGRGGGAAQRGAKPGSPAAPTPGMPIPMPGAVPLPGAPPRAVAPPEEDPAYNGPTDPFGRNRPSVPGRAPQAPPRTGVLSVLQNPNVAGTALAAAQQLTRARYPGETGMNNAVNAVTAGFNQLAQQKAMQQAREQLAQEQATKNAQWDREQKRKESDTSGENARRTAQSQNDANKTNNEKLQGETDRQYKARMAKVAEQNATSTKENTDSLKTFRVGELNAQEKRLKQAAEVHKLEQDKFEEVKRQFKAGQISKERYEKQKLSVDWAQVGVAHERNVLLKAKVGEGVDVKLMGEAYDDAVNTLRLQAENDFSADAKNYPEATKKLAEQLYLERKSKRDAAAAETPAGTKNPYR